MPGYDDIYMLHTAALSRYELEQKQSKAVKNKHHPRTFTASKKEAFSSSPVTSAPFSYNITPHLQPANESQGTSEKATKGSVVRVYPRRNFYHYS